MTRKLALRFEFKPAASNAERLNGYGAGALFVNDQPHWYGDPEQNEGLIEWTWVDLLEHVAKSWTYLVSEQSYPYPWLRHIAHPAEIWVAAEQRWERKGEAVAEQEEPLLLAFERRHNLAAAWKGISLPGLTWLRTGEVVWLCPDGRAPIRAKFADCLSELIRLCDVLVESFLGTSNPRVAAAIEAWKSRETVFREQAFSVATGLAPADLKALYGARNPFEFWGVSANESAYDASFAEGELLAAARMTAGIVNLESMTSILNAIRALPHAPSRSLEELSQKVAKRLKQEAKSSAFLDGYQAAEVVRDKAPTSRGRFFDVQAVLSVLKVQVREVSFGSDGISAIAVWGSRGPCVLLNAERPHADAAPRTRMTLAHELGHLVMDRTGGLPFCEVLGGAVDDFMERRAFAFAAELLIPRTLVEHEWANWRRSFSEFMTLLTQDFGVSKSVASAQVYNSSVFDRIDLKDQQRVEARLRLDGEHLRQRSVRIEAADDVV
jgi:Zn-dependent peptidase ImmA (M78 family)